MYIHVYVLFCTLKGVFLYGFMCVHCSYTCTEKNTNTYGTLLSPQNQAGTQCCHTGMHVHNCTL